MRFLHLIVLLIAPIAAMFAGGHRRSEKTLEQALIHRMTMLKDAPFAFPGLDARLTLADAYIYPAHNGLFVGPSPGLLVRYNSIEVVNVQRTPTARGSFASLIHIRKHKKRGATEAVTWQFRATDDDNRAHLPMLIEGLRSNDVSVTTTGAESIYPATAETDIPFRSTANKKMFAFHIPKPGMRADMSDSEACIFLGLSGLRLGPPPGLLVTYISIHVVNVQRARGTFSMDIRERKKREDGNEVVWHFSAMDIDALPMLLELLHSYKVPVTEAEPGATSSAVSFLGASDVSSDEDFSDDEGAGARRRRKEKQSGVRGETGADDGRPETETAETAAVSSAFLGASDVSSDEDFSDGEVDRRVPPAPRSARDVRGDNGATKRRRGKENRLVV